MPSLSRTGKYSVLKAVMVLFFLLLSVPDLSADQCPYLPGALKQVITEHYSDYIIRGTGPPAPGDLQVPGRDFPDGCYNLVRLSQSSYAILLLQPETGDYKLIVAESLLYRNMTGWVTYDIDSIEQGLPLLETAKSGMYLDVEKKKNFVITRNDMAFSMVLLPGGKEYVYKFLGKGVVNKYRIK